MRISASCGSTRGIILREELHVTADIRRFTFTTHVTSSLGWFGAVLVFLALAVTALTSDDETTVRGAYLVMTPAAWFVLVPLAHTSLVSGIVLSLSTRWGLLRHYWVVVKLALTVLATAILMVYMETFRQMASVAADPLIDLERVRNASPIVHAVLALVVLAVATVLGVYKPFGMTSYGRRPVDAIRHHSISSGASVSTGEAAGRSPLVYAIVVVCLLLAFVLLHLLRGSTH